MDSSPNLNLPYLMAAQAQKHVTHNEAIRDLDALVHLSVLDRDLTAPPSDPSNGDRYLVAVGATGDWLGKDEDIAAFQDGAWVFHTPQEGWVCWVADEQVLKFYDGLVWSDVSAAMQQSFDMLGVNATADTTNRLAVKSAAILFDHVGNGVQTKLNKNLAADTASLLMQTGLSGRAELGLAGDDDFHVKVSPDGSVWHESLVVQGASGIVSSPKIPAFSCSGVLPFTGPAFLTYATVDLNNGGHFNNTNGRFTAPVDGLYEFSCSFLGLDTYTGFINARFARNGVNLFRIAFGDSPAAQFAPLSGRTMINLIAGDYVQIQITEDAAIYTGIGSDISHFSGHLIG